MIGKTLQGVVHHRSNLNTDTYFLPLENKRENNIVPYTQYL